MTLPLAATAVPAAVSAVPAAAAAAPAPAPAAAGRCGGFQREGVRDLGDVHVAWPPALGHKWHLRAEHFL